MRCTLTILVTVASTVVVASAAAQADHGSLIGKRIRVTTPSTIATGDQRGARPLVVVGELIGTSDSTLSLRREATENEVIIPLSRVQRLEMSTGSSRGASAGKGALLGLAVGGVLGFATAGNCSATEMICVERPEGALIAGVVGATAGALIGLIAGGGERWKDTAIPRVSVVPTGEHSIAISSTIRFGSGRR